MEENSKKITKIVIGKEDELTDIVSGIIDSTNERILLTFAEESDLLISPVNLSVLLETSDENEKLLIAQIIKNPTGVRNAKSAGISTIETTTLPEEDVWVNEIKNKTERMTPKKKEIPIIQEKVEEEDGISINEDITPDETIPIVTPPIVAMPKEEKMERQLPKKKKERKPLSPKAKKMLLLIIPAVLVLAGIIAFIYYKTAPFVRIRIYTESREVAIERVFEGDSNIKEIDFENLKIPVKKESIEKARSATVKATGVAYKGNKAKGKIGIAYKKEGGCTDEGPLNLPAGTTVVSDGGRYFSLDAGIDIPCTMTPVETSVTANEIGPEYNLSGGTNFSVQNYSKVEVYGMNVGAITGGTKEEYTILQQSDVNKAMEELEEIAIEEGETGLKDKSGGSWEIIEASIKSEIDKGSIKTGVPIGGEAKETSLDLKVVSKAMYFFKEGFDEKLSELLTEEAQAKNLFETEKDLVLTLSNDVEKEISVVETSSDTAKIKVTAKASVEPKIEKESIISELSGKKWAEGNDILKKYIFSEKETEVIFKPENFPSGLRYFPSRQGGIVIELGKAD